MELCKKVQVEEHVIHVVQSTNFYTHLQFSLLASTWFPRPLGVCLWSASHMFLLLYKALMLLFLVPVVFVLAVLMDAYMVACLISMVLMSPFIFIFYFLGVGICIALAWLWLVISCQCCTMPGRAPGQSLGQYVRTAGGILEPQDLQDPQAAPVVEGGEGGASAIDGPCAFIEALCMSSFTLMFVNHVILVSFPYWREKLGDLSQEIGPWYDTIVI